METLNNDPKATEPVPASVPALEASNAVAATAPEAAAAPAVAATPAAAPAPAPAVAAAPAPVAAPAPPPVEIFRGVIPTTKGNVPGSWNRFAGYNPNDAKNKQKDGRGGGGSKGRR